MNKKLLTIMVIAVAFALVSSANASFNFGVKSLSYSTESYFSIVEINETYMPPQIAFHLGATAGAQAVIFGGVEIAKFSYESNEENIYDSKEKYSLFILSPFFGGKYYFSPMSSGHVSLYFSGTIFKSFASASYESEYTYVYKTYNSVSDDRNEEYLKELNSPFGFIPAFGAEYFFSDNFSLGGETGAKFAFSKADYEKDNYKEELKGSYIDHYIAITLNFFVD
ncbi:MAG: hypothetical protein AMJ90_09850 [candidate division Zixibacteria bacterium SM23_73_2]|nr:MAG: hypothetical protein AMJ90_09850 [candidate division Zixibacteria bacterium SM23_73_2]